MGAVKRVIEGLRKSFPDVFWSNTGGGCMAVELQFGYPVIEGQREYVVLITDREDVFYHGDFDSDDAVSGFHACLYVMGMVNGYVDYVHGQEEPVLIYRTGENVTDLATEADACLSAVIATVDLVGRANENGRTLD